MKRLFYYSGYRLTVFHWINGKFDSSYYFEPTDQGKEDFRHYLRKTPNVSSRLLVDVIEEDFRSEEIPHLYGKDKQAVIKRLADKYFRGSKQYIYYEDQGRHKTGRKDDKILISALTNVDLIRPWLDLFKEEDVPICGIWSLPHVSTKVLGRINAKTGHVLLISQQVSSNVRQTYFHNGKIITSRSATINLEGDTYGHFLSEEIDQTARFLTNKRYIGFDEALQVHIIAADKDIKSIEKECQSTPLRSVTVHKMDEIEKKVNKQGITGPYGNGIFAQLCIEDRFGKSHYGNQEDFAICNRFRVGEFLKHSSAAMIIAGVIYSLYLFIDIERLKSETALLKDQYQKIDENYELELKKLEPKLKQAQVMKSSVDLVRKLEEKKIISPQSFFVEISRALSNNQLSLIQIKEIKWSAYMDQNEDNNYYGTQVPIQLISDKLKHKAIIVGKVPVSADNIREAVDQVNRLADVLKNRKDISNVVIEKLPIDVRSSAQLSLKAGSEISKELPASEGGLFSISLIMQEPI